MGAPNGYYPPPPPPPVVPGAARFQAAGIAQLVLGVGLGMLWGLVCAAVAFFFTKFHSEGFWTPTTQRWMVVGAEIAANIVSGIVLLSVASKPPASPPKLAAIGLSVCSAAALVVTVTVLLAA